MLRVRQVLLAPLFLVSACLQPGQTHKFGLRGSGVVLDEYEAKISGFNSSLSGDTDYSSIEVGPTLATYDEDGVKLSTAELLVGFASFEDVDSTDLAGGGRFMFPLKAPVRPYCSFHAVSNFVDDIAGVDPGVQLGARLGLGAEVPLGQTGAYLDFGGDYLFPIIPAEPDLPGDIELEVEGFALRVGIGFEF